MSPIVLVVTGPPGVGKTTISKIISSKNKFAYLSGDEIKAEMFPEIEDITQFPNKLKKVKNELLRRTRVLFSNGKSVVVDYVVLGEDYVKRYRKIFKNDLRVKVLFPPLNVILRRDKSRACWTAGRESISEMYEKFRAAGYFDKEDFIDNSRESAARTARRLVVN